MIRPRSATVLGKLLERFVGGLGVLFAASLIVFAIVASTATPLAKLKAIQPPVPKSVLDAERQRLGLDDPLPVRYWNWLWSLLHGDFGPSVQAQRDIGAEIATRVGVTFRLVVAAIVIAVLLSLLAGTVSALYQRRLPDKLITPLSFVLIATPSFWLAVLLKEWGVGINHAVGYRIFSTIGANSAPPPGPVIDRALDIAAHLVLPTIVIAALHFATWTRYQRAAVAQSLAGDHVRFAVMHGLGRKRIVASYVIRTSLIPLITVVALDMPVLLSGTVIVESIFNWQGMGVFLLQSITMQDTNAILGWLMLSGVVTVFFNLIADLLYLVADPRIRHEAR